MEPDPLDTGGAARPERRAPDDDPFRPPRTNCIVVCLHCQEQYDSYRIQWREFESKPGERQGFWCCPTPGCDGKGFHFDIHPIDANWEDDEDRGMTGGWFDDNGNRVSPLDDGDGPPF